MEDLFMANSSQNDSYNHSSISDDYSDYDYGYYDYLMNLNLIGQTVTYVIIGVGIPLTLVAMYFVFSLVRNDHLAPIYVINIMISDLIQFCCLLITEVAPWYWDSYITSYTREIGVLTSVGFMVCLSLERYLVIAHPLWYRYRRSIKLTVLVCLVVWASSIVVVLSYGFMLIAFLLPFPLLIFFLVGTLRALSSSVSVHSDEKRRIVGTLVLVLLMYTLLFLPVIIHFLPKEYSHFTQFYTLYILAEICLRLNPLADLILYVFMRKGTIDRCLTRVCCCIMESSDTSVLRKEGESM
ncbi:G-protein coupled receptor 4-like [Cheilinus undulatus]|uniref:G-protein coupled receptor 4-like n=1 Tax=Cheilinus undulatus TaxID=241271 RepID=UPI001BD3F4ED|nr:G-protein coupled receptor 4-like [Cheilinus undulatus]